MPTILLATINARYSHASFALRCLLANLAELSDAAAIREFTNDITPAEIAERLLAENPRIIAMAVYIWNAPEISRLAGILKAVSPQTVLVLGGPEVSHQPLRVDFSAADYIVQGEGETVFRELCRAVLSGAPPPTGCIAGIPVDPACLELPYRFYSEADIAGRVVYVETSRGCPYTCEFCLSSIDSSVRYFDLDRLLGEFAGLWERGARHFKFIDRTFNLDPERAARVLDFFLEREAPYLAHFEMVPERFPDSLLERLRRFPPAALQLEIGVQTLHPELAARIGRRVDPAVVLGNLALLEAETSAHLHVDLLVGLPGQTMEDFAVDLDVLAAGHAEIQIGILKKLSGTALGRHDRAFGMVYSGAPPYEILQTATIPFAEMQAVKRFARLWDLVYNRGNFRTTVRRLIAGPSAHTGFAAFSEWAHAETRGDMRDMSLDRLARLLFRFLVERDGADSQETAGLLLADLAAIGNCKPPGFLREHAGPVARHTGASHGKGSRRQRKHAGPPADRHSGPDRVHPADPRSGPDHAHPADSHSGPDRVHPADSRSGPDGSPLL